MSYVYGPVPSRRLGRSLGIDLVPFKTCSYDCTYCQLGHTTNLTLDRRAWVPLDDVEAEIREKLALHPDYITISGSGEPTLHSGLGALVDRIRTFTDTPVAVLTNGSLLWDDEVRRELAAASLVMPSLDAGNSRTFAQVNRPHPGLSFSQLLRGLVKFRESYRGQYWLEMLLVAGCTDTALELYDLKWCASQIRPDRVQLNTVVRPPGDPGACPVPHEKLARIARLFEPPAQVIDQFNDDHRSADDTQSAEDLFALLQRRPCTLEDLAGGLRLDVLEVVKHLEVLTRARRVGWTRIGSEIFYVPRTPCPHVGAQTGLAGNG